MLASLTRPSRFLVLAGSLFFVVPTSASRVNASTPDDVNVVNSPEVRVKGIDASVLRDLRRLTPQFVRAKKRYAFTWNPGEPEQNYVVVAVEDDGWVGTIMSDSPQPELVVVVDPREIRWINVTRAFSIREIIPPER